MIILSVHKCHKWWFRVIDDAQKILFLLNLVWSVSERNILKIKNQNKEPIFQMLRYLKRSLFSVLAIISFHRFFRYQGCAKLYNSSWSTLSFYGWENWGPECRIIAFCSKPQKNGKLYIEPPLSIYYSVLKFDLMQASVGIASDKFWFVKSVNRSCWLCFQHESYCVFMSL